MGNRLSINLSTTRGLGAAGIAAAFMALAFTTCSGAEGSGDSSGLVEDVGEPPSPAPSCQRQEALVRLETEDAVELVGDYIPPASSGGRAVVLVHMIPPTWTRASYPPRVREALAGTGAAVLNIDRRGAGESSGDPVQAYQGPGGRLDIEAAVRFLIAPERACPADPTRITLVGASNGTTAVWDYTLQHDEGLPDPAAIAWLSPGSYTENQNPLQPNRELLDRLPLLLVYPSSEPWSAPLAEQPSPLWRVIEIEDGLHGTRNFELDAASAILLPAMVDWLQTSLR